MQLLADPNLLRNALLTYSEKVIELEHKVEVMQPTMEAFARIARAEGSMCLTDAAKALQQEPHKFNKWLHMNDWITNVMAANIGLLIKRKLKRDI